MITPNISELVKESRRMSTVDVVFGRTEKRNWLEYLDLSSLQYDNSFIKINAKHADLLAQLTVWRFLWALWLLLQLVNWNISHNHLKWALLLLILEIRSWDRERLNNLPSVTQPADAKSSFEQRQFGSWDQYFNHTIQLLTLCKDSPNFLTYVLVIH